MEGNTVGGISQRFPIWPGDSCPIPGPPKTKFLEDTMGQQACLCQQLEEQWDRVWSPCHGRRKAWSQKPLPQHKEKWSEDTGMRV